MDNVYCNRCGATVRGGAAFCQQCGAAMGQQTAPTPGAPNHPPYYAVVQPKLPWLAALLSVLLTGIGQIYNGELTKGLIMLVSQLVLCSFLWLLIPIPFALLLWLWSIIDAYNAAKKLNNQALAGVGAPR